jgi:excinuclease UvrABC ATPase subunit
VNDASHGEYQRLRIAHAVCEKREPSIIFFDRPDTGFRTGEMEPLRKELERLARAGHTVIITSGEPELAGRADYAVEVEFSVEHGVRIRAAGQP